MFRRRKAPSKSVNHQEGCPIVKADPGVEIPWSYDGDGLWRAECVCTTEYFREPTTDSRVRLDPFDPATARHLGQCEYVSETDAAVLKILLKVKPGLGEGLRLGRVRLLRRGLAGSALRRGERRVTTNPLPHRGFSAACAVVAAAHLTPAAARRRPRLSVDAAPTTGQSSPRCSSSMPSPLSDSSAVGDAARN
jgi:hypothetical protein